LGHLSDESIHDHVVPQPVVTRARAQQQPGMRTTCGSVYISRREVR